MRNFPRLVLRPLFIATLLWQSAVYGAQAVTWMYEVEVAVADQSAEARSYAARAGLLEVLARGSGQQTVAPDTVGGALESPERFYSRYSYGSERVDGERQWHVILQFEPSAVQRLARDAALPIWSSRRPEVIAWLASRDGGEYRLATEEDDPIREALEAQARVRGVPVVIPEQLPPARIVWEGADEPLSRHARSLEAEWLLVGQVQEADAVARGRFELSELADGGNAESFNLRAEAVDEVLRRAVNRVTNTLAQRYAVLGGDAGLVTLRVQGIADVTAYAAMMRYLQSLEYLTGVDVGEVGDGYIELWLETAADEARISDLLVGDGRMATPEFEDVLSLDLVLDWRG